MCACLASAATDTLWQKLRTRYMSLKTLTGTFDENICSEQAGTCLSFEGRFSIGVPSRYRLEVTDPQKQVIVSDSATLWVYMPEEKRAMKQAAGGFAPVLAFLGPILDSTATGVVVKDSFGEYAVDVVMSEEMSALSGLKLQLDSTAKRITGFSCSDPWGNKYTFRLRNQKWNPKLPGKLFKFTPPAGTTVEE